MDVANAGRRLAAARGQVAVAGNGFSHPAPPGLFIQKKSRVATATEGRLSRERDQNKRREFQEQVKPIAPAALIFLDESGFSLALLRRKRRSGSVLYGWGKNGAPLPTRSRVSDVEAVPARRGKNLSVLGAFDIEGMVATTSKQGAMTRADFERFLRRDLLPRLLPGCVLVRVQARLRWTTSAFTRAGGSNDW